MVSFEEDRCQNPNRIARQALPVIVMMVLDEMYQALTTSRLVCHDGRWEIMLSHQSDAS